MKSKAVCYVVLLFTEDFACLQLMYFLFLAGEMDCPITVADFDASISKVQPSVGKQDLKKFVSWMDEYGSQ